VHILWISKRSVTKRKKMPEITEEELTALNEAAAKVADLQEQFDKVLAKKEELLTETKQAKEKQRLADEQARLDQEELAKKKGDYEQLHKSAMSENEKLKEAIQERDTRDAKNAVESTAMKLSISVADGDNAEMLSRFVADRLQYADGGVKVLDKDGQLTISTLDQLKEEIISDSRFAALLKGNQSSGGGATGGSNSGGAANSNKTQTSTQRIAEGLKEL